MPATNPADREGQIELKPGVPWVSAYELNRLARQQGLCLAIAQAWVYDMICQAVQLSEEEVDAVKAYLAQEEIADKAELQQFLQAKGGIS